MTEISEVSKKTTQRLDVQLFFSNFCGDFKPRKCCSTSDVTWESILLLFLFQLLSWNKVIFRKDFSTRFCWNAHGSTFKQTSSVQKHNQTDTFGNIFFSINVRAKKLLFVKASLSVLLEMHTETKPKTQNYTHVPSMCFLVRKNERDSVIPCVLARRTNN